MLVIWYVVFALRSDVLLCSLSGVSNWPPRVYIQFTGTITFLPNHHLSLRPPSPSPPPPPNGPQVSVYISQWVLPTNTYPKPTSTLSRPSPIMWLVAFSRVRLLFTWCVSSCSSYMSISTHVSVTSLDEAIIHDEAALRQQRRNEELILQHEEHVCMIVFLNAEAETRRRDMAGTA